MSPLAPAEEKLPIARGQHHDSTLVRNSFPIRRRNGGKREKSVESTGEECVTPALLPTHLERPRPVPAARLLEKRKARTRKFRPAVLHEPETEKCTPLGRGACPDLRHLENVAMHHLGVLLGGDPPESLLVFGQGIETPGGRPRRRRPASGERPDHTATDKDTRPSLIAVAGILDPRKLARPRVGFDLGASPVEKGTQKITRSKRPHHPRATHRRPAVSSPAAEEGEHETLETIVGVVGGQENPLWIETRSEPGVAGGPPARFDPARAGGLILGETPHLEGQAVLPAEGGDSRERPIRVLAAPMVEVQNRQRAILRVHQVKDKIEKDERIAPAGDGRPEGTALRRDERPAEALDAQIDETAPLPVRRLNRSCRRRSA